MSPASYISRYAAIVPLVGAALAITWLLPVLRIQTPGPLFLAAIGIGAWYCGLGPAIFAALLSTIAIEIFLITTPGANHLMGGSVRLLVFSLAAVLVSSLSAARKKAENALKDQNALLEMTLAGTADAVIATDAQGTVTFVNEVAERLTGVSKDQAIGKDVDTVLNLASEETGVRFKNPALTAAQLGAAFSNGSGTILIDSQGREIPVEDSSSPIRRSDGTIAGAVVVFRDMTERRAAEKMLRARNEQLQLALEAASMGTWDYDLTTSIVRWSANLEELHGLPPGSFEGTFAAFLANVHPEDRDPVLAHIQASIQGSKEHSIEYRIIRPDQTVCWLEERGQVVRDKAGRTVGLTGVCMDVTERKQTEETLVRLASIVESSEDAIIGKTLDGTIFSWNEGASRLYGYSEEEMLGRSVSLLAPPERKDDVPQILERLKEGGSFEHFETLRVRKDQSLINVALTISPVRDSKGNVIAASTIARDITEAKIAEESLRRWERLFLHSGWGVAIVEPADNTLQAVNPAFAEMHSITIEELIGRPLSDVVAIEERADLLYHLRTADENGQHAFETLHQTREGRRFPVVTDLTSVKDAEGRVLYRAANFRDITDRRRSESEREELLASEREARRLAEEARGRIAFLAGASAELTASLNYEATLEKLARLAVPYLADWCIIDVIKQDGEISRIAAVHKDPGKQDLLSELRRYPPDPAALLGVANVLRTGKPEITVNPPDLVLGEPPRNQEQLRLAIELGAVSCLSLPLIARGRTLGVISLVLTDTDRTYGTTDLALGEELAHRAAVAIDNARLYREAQQANRIKDEFVATVSHELRTPLNAMLGWAHLLRSGSLDPIASERALETIERNARLQSQLIEDLLDISRIITGKLTLDLQNIEMVPVVEAAIQAVKPGADAKGIRIESNLIPCVVAGDANRLQQVVWNLLSNAIKFTPQGGQVTVSLDHVANNMEVSVRDTGQGIKEQFLPYVFDRFSQGDGSTARRHGGLGIGLAIVRHLVELHGGTVLAESTGEGRGATFTVSIPARALQSLEYSHSLEPGSSNPGFDPTLIGLRLLVVDDEADARFLLQTLLTNCGAEVRCAATTQEALSIADEWKFEVLISDIGMPKEDGYELIRRIRARSPEAGGRVPAIAVTAYARPEDRFRALSAGFQSHISKPIDQTELLRAISSVSGRSQSFNA